MQKVNEQLDFEVDEISDKELARRHQELQRQFLESIEKERKQLERMRSKCHKR